MVGLDPGGRSGTSSRRTTHTDRTSGASLAAKKLLRRGAGKLLYDLYYRFLRTLPIDDRLAVYSSYRNRAPRCNPGAIQKEAFPEGEHGVPGRGQ